MRHASAAIALLLLGVATSAPAAGVAPQTAAATQRPVTGATALAAQIRRALLTSRDQARAEGIRGEALELAVAAAVEAVIADSGADPVVVMEALKLALAEERCVPLDEARWSGDGCAALSRTAAAVTAALGGPAAGGGSGGVPGVAGTPPPPSASGSDYSSN